jgi:hypothetical protein
VPDPLAWLLRVVSEELSPVFVSPFGDYCIILPLMILLGVSYNKAMTKIMKKYLPIETKIEMDKNVWEMVWIVVIFTLSGVISKM